MCVVCVMCTAVIADRTWPKPDKLYLSGTPYLLLRNVGKQVPVGLCLADQWVTKVRYLH